MRNVPLYLFCLLILPCLSEGQSTPVLAIEPPLRFNHLGAISLHVPLGEFANSHFAGVSLDHSWSHHRFGTDSLTHKKIGFIVNSGFQFFAGKKITVAGNDFRFGNFLSLVVQPGMIYTPRREISVAISGGPALNLYKKVLSFGYGGQLWGIYFISDRLAIGPGANVKKRKDTNALWAIMGRIAYAF